MTQQDYIVHASTMSIVTINSDDNPVKATGSDPLAPIALERGLKVLKELEKIPNEQFPRVLETDREEGRLSITMTRVGTHDLSDVIHEIPIGMVPQIISSMTSALRTLHDRGFVHRDLKPGNFMFDYSGKNGIKEFAGIIDFGMTLRINRKQNEPGAMGGTRPYSHPSQREHKELRAHPGQDWFAFARTVAHLLIGGGPDSLASLIESGEIGSKIDRAMEKVWGNEIPRDLQRLIHFAIKPSSEKADSLPELSRLGKKISSELLPTTLPTSGTFHSALEADKALFPPARVDAGEISFQEGTKRRPKRHDLLLIVDSTGSMSEEIEDLRSNLDEVAREVSSNLDLRVDIWSLGDYSREENTLEEPVSVIGKRLRSSALRMAIGRIDADSEQYDDAEAYETALQDAYIRDDWSPRKSSTRSIVLIGDSYAHGWLTRNYWGNFYFEMKESKSEDYADKLEMFEDRHPNVLAWWIRKEEQEARDEAVSTKSEHDDFSDRGHVLVPTTRGSKHRPNIHNALERCVSVRGANVHAIFAGENLVARNFMKYAAMMGEGTFTEVSDGELKLALTGLITSPDKELFEDFKNEVDSTNPETEVLNSITSFVHS